MPKLQIFHSQKRISNVVRCVDGKACLRGGFEGNSMENQETGSSQNYFETARSKIQKYCKEKK